MGDSSLESQVELTETTRPRRDHKIKNPFVKIKNPIKIKKLI